MKEEKGENVGRERSVAGKLYMRRQEREIQGKWRNLMKEKIGENTERERSVGVNFIREQTTESEIEGKRESLMI